MRENIEALEYHSSQPAGKIEIRATKPFVTQRDLSLAYTPGVAEPCREIHKNPEAVFDYTAKGNLVAVVTNGTAVLGLGDIGPAAGKPVMEGKAVLFKRFAGIDVFDIELDAPDVDTFCNVVRAMAPTFGGINIEDVKAPDCFVIEKRLREELDIPVFHDDQHGTAIITAAGLENALLLAEKSMADVKVVFSGAGAAALATASLIQVLGVQHKNIYLCDSRGVVRKGDPRIDGDPYKSIYAQDTDAESLADVLVGADVFIGVSVAGILQPEMLQHMAEKPVIFALANPDPEIPYADARAARPDAIVATGRSDFPNQVNNVLGFPFIFRGALDVRARTVNEPMMIAAVRALADLAREDVEDSVAQIYQEELRFGPEYIIPKPFDSRVLLRVAPAVALAASMSGVARRPIADVEEYRASLGRFLGKEHELMRFAVARARSRPQRIVLANGENEKVLRAVSQLVDERIIQPVLIGKQSTIEKRAGEIGLDLSHCRVIDMFKTDLVEDFAQRLFERRSRKGMTLEMAERRMHNRDWFAAMMVQENEADGMVGGLTSRFPEALRPVLTVVGTAPDAQRVAGAHLMVLDNKIYFFADTTINLDPTAEDLAEIACLTADLAKSFDEDPRIAMLSFSNFGSVNGEHAERVRKATELVRTWRPDLEVEGEMHADAAMMHEQTREYHPFSRLTKRANVLVFPSLEAGNIAQKIVACAGGQASVGPILVGLNRPVSILSPYSGVRDIVMSTAITAMMASASDSESPEDRRDVDLLRIARLVEKTKAEQELSADSARG
jgi:malate dehydrogenase (oxaloacetate-decarboxylating)(NADP+)